jgi:hypothetical protein
LGFLKKIFGSNRDEIWRQLSHEIGGEFVEGSFTKSSRVKVQIKEWVVTLDTFTVSTGNSSSTYTRMRAPYVNPDQFRFTIYRRSVFSNLGKLLGMQDVSIGEAAFDEAFIIKANDEAKVRQLFQTAKLREMVASQPRIHLTVKDDEGWFGAEFPDGVDELCFQVGGVLKDIDQLKSLYLLLAVTLSSLCHLGSAYEDDPNVEL